MGRGTGTVARGGITSVLSRPRNQIKSLEEYLAMSKKEFEKEFYIAPYNQRLEVFCLLAESLQEGRVDSERAQALAHSLLEKEYRDLHLSGDGFRLSLGLYGSKGAWINGINKFYESNDPLLEQAEKAGINTNKLCGYFKRDPFQVSLVRSKAEESLTLHLLETNQEPKEQITVENIVERGYAEAAIDSAEYTREDLETILAHRPVILNESSDAKDLTRALSQLLGAIHSEIHLSGTRQERLREGRLLWQVLQDDWHAWKNYEKEAAEGVPEGLRHDFHRPSNAITALSEALNIPEEKTVKAIEKIAETIK